MTKKKPGKALPLDRLVGKEQTAHILGVSQRTVRRLIDRGDLPAIKVGAQWRLTERDIATFIAAQRSA